MLTKFKLPSNIQIILFELNLRKASGFLSVFINHLCKTINISSVILSDLLDFYSNERDIKVVLGDFNLEPSSVAFYLSWIAKLFLA